MLTTISGSSPQNLNAQDAIAKLERGDVLFFPELSFPFTPEEQVLYSDALLTNRKNISYNAAKDKVHGIKEHEIIAKKMLARYEKFAHEVVDTLFPSYKCSLFTGRTSFRPAEIYGRKPKSYRKDDTRVHIDAFPASPNQGKRLLRVFTNVNPKGKPRVWQVGEPFPELVKKFSSQLELSHPAKKYLFRILGVTKSLRSDYDELMLQLHNKMKGNLDYQNKIEKSTIEFPAGCTWIVFSDQVSHAALSGQYCLEQTFMLPVDAMQDPLQSPLKVLEKIFARQLV